jgi:hypothetical protein
MNLFRPLLDSGANLGSWKLMPRYYFDLRDGDELAVDEEGVELRDIDLVQEEAARSLADMARDVVRRPAHDRNLSHQLAIEVRDDHGPVMQVKFTFAVEKLKH